MSAPLDKRGLRLNQYLAKCGIATRKKADAFIKDGLVKVDGKVVKEMGFRVGPKMQVSFKNKIVSPQGHSYILVNKPAGDEGSAADNTIFSRVAKAMGHDLVEINPLNAQSCGLVVLTNDKSIDLGGITPSSLFVISLEAPITDEDFEVLKSKKWIGEIARVQGEPLQIGLECLGENEEELRAVLFNMNYMIRKTDRVLFCDLTKKELPRGKWRRLGPMEIGRLKQKLSIK